VLLMAWRKRSLKGGPLSVVSWCFNAGGLIRGLIAPQRADRLAIDSVQIRNIQNIQNTQQGAEPACCIVTAR
jgi:hypothetical protein